MSGWMNVLSGAPRESVGLLGARLIHIYINDLDLGIKWAVKVCRWHQNIWTSWGEMDMDQDLWLWDGLINGDGI